MLIRRIFFAILDSAWTILVLRVICIAIYIYIFRTFARASEPLTVRQGAASVVVLMMLFHVMLGDWKPALEAIKSRKGQ